MTVPMWVWVAFHVFILFVLALDLGVFHRRAREVKMGEALAWSAVWISMALVFSVLVWHWRGPEAGMAWTAAWLIEKALSVDNIFVFVMVFSYFKVPPAQHHRVLFWGILGALVMRAVFIAAGVTLLNAFHAVIYVFGALLIWSGIKMLFMRTEDTDLGNNRLVKFLERHVHMTPEYDDQGRFRVKRDGRWVWTPLLAVLVVVEATDLVFAIDSIPAVLAVSSDPFIVYTSNVMAILGLRALYFALAGLMGAFRYLNVGLCLILVFVGAKMMLTDVVHVPIGVALGIISGILAVFVVASLIAGPERPAMETVAPARE